MKLFRKLTLVLTVAGMLLLGTVGSLAAELPSFSSEEEYPAEPDPEELTDPAETTDPFADMEEEELEIDEEMEETEPPADTTEPTETTSADIATETAPSDTSDTAVTGSIPEQYLTSDTSVIPGQPPEQYQTSETAEPLPEESVPSETIPTDTLPPETAAPETTTEATTAPIVYDTPAPTAAETTTVPETAPETTPEETTSSEDDAVIGDISENTDLTTPEETTPSEEVTSSSGVTITVQNPSEPEAAEPFPVGTVAIVAVVLIALGVAVPLVFNYFRKKKIYTY